MPRRPRNPRKRDDVSEDQYTAAFEVLRHHVAFLFAAVRHQLAMILFLTFQKSKTG